MEQFGIQFQRDKDRLHLYRKEIDKLPDHIYIRNRSFSSTNIAISCAVEHRMKITIENPSIEPEIIDLLDMISTAGVKLQWDDNCSLLQLDARNVDLDREI
jgi:UDP-N-acetylglucosamine enolpyruvyl transferase